MRLNVPTFKTTSPPTPSPSVVAVTIDAPFSIVTVSAVSCTSPPFPAPDVIVLMLEPLVSVAFCET